MANTACQRLAAFLIQSGHVVFEHLAQGKRCRACKPEYFPRKISAEMCPYPN